MPARHAGRTLLLVEADVIIRYALAEYLRACAFTVIEAPSAEDAKAILVAGPKIGVLISDAQLAGDENGFALAQWARRHRPKMEVILTSSVANKAQLVSEFCARYPDQTPPSDSATLASRVQAMMAERKRRIRRQPTTSLVAAPRRRR